MSVCRGNLCFSKVFAVERKLALKSNYNDKIPKAEIEGSFLIAWVQGHIYTNISNLSINNPSVPSHG